MGRSLSPANAVSKDPQFCYVTTRGRTTGNPHEIEIWFAREPGANTIYMLSGGGDRSDWVRNIRANAELTVRIADDVHTGSGRIVDPATEEDALARRVIGDKYGRGPDLTRWLREALPVAIDLGERS
jgi:deazaflavin-dependent oxidoreductase (nitroreductase family)